jgi:sRNA-binding protein
MEETAGFFFDQSLPMEGWMTISKQDIHAALTHLAEAFPQTFLLERCRPHRPLKVGIAADLQARCPALEWRVLKVALAAYTGRVMYLRGLVAGAGRIDLDGNVCGEVSAADTEYATVKLAEILAAREARKAAAVATKGAAQVAAAAAALLAVKVLTLKKKPVLRLAAFRRQ